MTDVTQETDAFDADRAAGLPQKSSLPIVLAAGGAIALGVGVFLALRGSSDPAETHEAKGAPGESSAATGPGAMGPIVNLDSFVVNLNDAEELHYLKCTIAVELTDPKWAPQFERQTVRIRNGVLLYLSSLKLAETVGIANKEKIQTALRERTTELAGAPMVKAIYLTEFVLQ